VTAVERYRGLHGDAMRCARCGCEAALGPDGLWHCTAPPSWCQAYPQPGREAVASSAITRQEWGAA